MANDVRKRSTNKGNTQKDISRTRINRQAKKKQQNYIKSHRRKKKFRFNIKRKAGFYLDYSLMFIMLLLIGVGLVMVYSSSSTTKETIFDILKSQVLFAVVGIFFMILEARIVDYHIYSKKWVSYGLYIFSLFLVLLLLTPLGKNVNGATRWIGLGSFSFMPVEVVKVGVIAALSFRIVNLGDRMKNTFSLFWLWFFYGVVPAGLLYVISNNLSSAIIISGMCFIITFVAFPGYKPFAAVVGVGGVGATLLVTRLVSTLNSGDNFRHARILAWLHPEDYADNKAYQTIHGLYAIGSGGLFGKGLGKSMVKIKLPEAYNDMIFTIICEELGLFGALCVLLAFGVLLWRIAHVAKNAPDLLGALLCTGVFAHISLQVLVNIAVVTNTIPNTGVTLPFISKGGTALLILLMEMGVVFNVSSQIKDELNE